VTYVNAIAGSPLLAPGSADLICAAQAVHWFDLERFYADVRRVAAPDGIIAVWTYILASVDESIDKLAKKFCYEIVGPYWPPERRYVDENYSNLPFPFTELAPPAFTMEQQWTADQFLGYLGTWSSVGRYRELCGSDPLEVIAEPLRELWGKADAARTVTWPLVLRVARVHERQNG
jgi:SAM-dependent methyltransferase